MLNHSELRDQVSALLPDVVAKPDDELVQSIWPVLRSEMAIGEFAGASPWDAIVEWSRTELPRLCRKAGDAGGQVLTYVRDPNTQHDAERVAIVAGFLLARLTHVEVELHAAMALVVLLVRVTSRGGSAPH